MTDLLQLLQRYKFDPAKETEGVWHTVNLDGEHSIEIKVARKTCRAYRDRVLSFIIPLLGKAEKGEDVEDGVIGETWAKVMAGTMLTDWRGLELDGVEFPFSEEAAVLVLTELPEFRDEVMKLARDDDKYIEDDLEAVADRLGKTWRGLSNTEASPENQESESE